MSRTFLFTLTLCALYLAWFFTNSTPVHENTLANKAPLTPSETAAAPEAERPLQPATSTKTSALIAKESLLNEIITKKNDNDPRLDTEFKNLNDEEKGLIQKKYFSFLKESLNERGTLVFLLGREIKTLNDLSFIQSVALEKPCSSFENCQSSRAPKNDEHANVDNVTLAYPQIVAIKSLEKIILSGSHAPTLKSSALSTLRELSQSPHTLLSSLAGQAIDNSNSL